jgi:hypothetical protein
LAYIQDGHFYRKIEELLTDMGMPVSHTTLAKAKKQAEAEKLGVIKKRKKLVTNVYLHGSKGGSPRRWLRKFTAPIHQLFIRW